MLSNNGLTIQKNTYLLLLLTVASLKTIQIYEMHQNYTSHSWEYSIRRILTSDFSVAIMHDVTIIFFQLGAVRKSIQKL